MLLIYFIATLPSILSAIICYNSVCSAKSEHTFVTDNNLSKNVFQLSLTLQHLNNKNNLSENFVHSPLGFALALGQISIGANLKLRKTINQLLGVDSNSSLDHFHECVKTDMKQILHPPPNNSNGSNFKLNISMAMFVDDNIELRKNFVTQLKNYYETEIISLPIQKQFSYSQRFINNYTSNATHGLITSLPITKETASVLSNIIYFTADWVSPFAVSYTRKSKFYMKDNRTATIRYMLGQKDMFYVDDINILNCKLLRLPYKSTTNETAYSMYILLPHTNLTDLTNRLTEEKFEELLATGTERLVNIKIPKIHVKQKLQIKKFINDVRGDIDINDNDVDQTDIFRLIEASDNPLLTLSDVRQEIDINVSEYGTTAAAVTGGIVNYDGFSRNFNANKPYLFLIRNDYNKLILFWGAIHDPTLL